jgi:hypothetical protein
VLIFLSYEIRTRDISFCSLTGLTQRLGPPQAKPFPERKPPAAVERPSGSGSGGVFNRLGASVNPEPAAPVAKVIKELALDNSVLFNQLNCFL